MGFPSATCPWSDAADDYGILVVPTSAGDRTDEETRLRSVVRFGDSVLGN